jgi:hypothetical protein
MIDCAVRIEEGAWEEALAAAGRLPPYGLEVPVSLLEACPRFVQRFELEDLGIVNIREALPLEHAPYMDECPPAIRRGLTDSLAATLELGRCFGARCASLDLGLDRIRGAVGLLNRARILTDALAVSVDGPVLCVQIRVPRRFPLSREWRLAKELVSECDSARVGVAANVVIHDISPQPSPQEVREVLGDGLRLVRFLLDGPAPACLTAETIETWAAALADWERPPAVVFGARFRTGADLAPFHAAAARVARSLFGA